MKSIIYSELLKLKKKSTLFYLPISMGLVALVIAFTSCISLYFHFKGQTHKSAIVNLANKYFMSSGVVLILFFLGVSLLALSASSIASEYSLGTIKNCFLNQPRRSNFLAGKFLAMTIYGSTLYAVSCFITIFATMIFGLVGGIKLSAILSIHTLLTTVSVCTTSYLAVLSYLILGLGLGTVLRSPTQAIALPLIWLVVIEPLISGVAKILSPFLFGNAVAKMATPHNLGGFSGNLLIVLVYLIPLTAYAYRLIICRDI